MFPLFIIVNIAGKEYRGEAPKMNQVEEKIIIAVLSSFSAKDMDHVANLREAKLTETKPAEVHSTGVEMITIDDDEETVNNEEVSSTTLTENLVHNYDESDANSDGFGDYVSRYNLNFLIVSIHRFN